MSSHFSMKAQQRFQLIRISLLGRAARDWGHVGDATFMILVFVGALWTLAGPTGWWTMDSMTWSHCVHANSPLWLRDQSCHFSVSSVTVLLRVLMCEVSVLRPDEELLPDQSITSLVSSVMSKKGRGALTDILIQAACLSCRRPWTDWEPALVCWSTLSTTGQHHLGHHPTLPDTI